MTDDGWSDGGSRREEDYSELFTPREESMLEGIDARDTEIQRLEQELDKSIRKFKLLRRHSEQIAAERDAAVHGQAGIPFCPDCSQPMRRPRGGVTSGPVQWVCDACEHYLMNGRIQAARKALK